MNDKSAFNRLKGFLRTKLGMSVTAIAAIIILAVAIGIPTYLHFQKNNYRSITIFELNGSATITRSDKSLAAYKGMMLSSGDNVTVDGTGYIRLKLDDDKYITLEPNTQINLSATGTSTDSNTKIELITGAITNEINNKLNNNSSYEVTTPASTMAVRGTVFRVSLTQSEEGTYTVDIAVLDGVVATKPIMPNGTISSEEVLVKTGTTAEISSYGDVSEFVFSNVNIDYSTLPAIVLERILELKENSCLPDLDINTNELNEIINTQKGEVREAGTQGVSNESPSVVSTTEPATRQQAEVTVPTTAPATVPTTAGSMMQPYSVEASSEVTAPSKEILPESPTQASAEYVTTSNNSTTTETTAQAADDESSDDSSSTTETSSATPTIAVETTAATPTTAAETTAPPITYKITFITGDISSTTIFATQSVISGQAAKEPILSPSQYSTWCIYTDGNYTDYNFDSAVTQNITLYSPID